MKEVARLQIKDRTELFQAAAISMGMQPNVIEKDFWEKEVAFKQKFYYAKGVSE